MLKAKLENTIDKFWIYSFFIVPVIVLGLFYILRGGSLSLCSLDDSLVEVIITTSSILVGFAGSLITTIILNRENNILTNNMKDDDFKQYALTFWRSVWTGIAASVLGILILISKDFHAIAKEAIIALWILAFSASIWSFFDGFSFTINKILDLKK